MILTKRNPNAKEVDIILFNELMNMITGDLAVTRYIAQNVKKSGLEIWRKLHRNNDPNTHGSKETLKRKIEQLALNRCKDVKELSEILENCEWNADTIGKAIPTGIKNQGGMVKDAYKTLYMAILNREKGPRLASILYEIGREKALHLLGQT